MNLQLNTRDSRRFAVGYQTLLRSVIPHVLVAFHLLSTGHTHEGGGAVNISRSLFPTQSISHLVDRLNGMRMSTLRGDAAAVSVVN